MAERYTYKAPAERMKEPDKTAVEKAAVFGKKVTIVTFPIALGVGALGIATGNPVLAAAGFGSAGIDTVQYVGAKHIEKRESDKRKLAAAKQGEVMKSGSVQLTTVTEQILLRKKKESTSKPKKEYALAA